MEKILIKAVATEQNKTRIISFYAAILLVLYSLSGQFHIGSIRYLPLSEGENSIPFIIESIWIYVMLYPFLILTALSIKNIETFNKIFYAFIILTIISLMIFQIIPVAYPREFFPLPHYNQFTVNLFHKIRLIDSPTNCFPSLHVSLCFLISFFCWDESKFKFFITSLVSILISISTLTTKQHYIADIISGFLIAFAVFYCVRNWTVINESR